MLSIAAMSAAMAKNAEIAKGIPKQISLTKDSIYLSERRLDAAMASSSATEEAIGLRECELRRYQGELEALHNIALKNDIALAENAEYLRDRIIATEHLINIHEIALVKQREEKVSSSETKERMAQLISIKEMDEWRIHSLKGELKALYDIALKNDIVLEVD